MLRREGWAESREPGSQSPCGTAEPMWQLLNQDHITQQRGSPIGLNHGSLGFCSLQPSASLTDSSLLEGGCVALMAWGECVGTPCGFTGSWPLVGVTSWGEFHVTQRGDQC